jgi:putative ABC transport system permease protein
MKLVDLVEFAWRSVRASRLRNALTAMGIAVGVASLVSMLSLGIGLQRLASTGIERSGLFDTLTVTPIEGGEGPGFGAPAPKGESRILDEAARNEIAKLPEAREVYPSLTFSADWKHGQDPARRATAQGTPMSAMQSEPFSGVQGRFFSAPGAPEVILQKQFASGLTGASGSSGATLTALAKKWVGASVTFTYPQRTSSPDGGFNVAFQNQTVTVVGIVNDVSGRGPPGRGGQTGLFLPLGYAEKLHPMQESGLRDAGAVLSRAPVYSSLIVRLKSPSQAASAEAAIKKMGFNTFSAIDATSALRQVFAVVDLFLGAFGSLALAVASIGIVNTLVMTILERRREIGIMKAVGASDTDVRRIFLAEAAVLGVAGGAMGVLIGWSIGKIINFGANVFIQRQGLPSQQIWFVPWWLVGGALAFSLFASLLSGAYPATRAARLEPLDALRYE